MRCWKQASFDTIVMLQVRNKMKTTATMIRRDNAKRRIGSSNSFISYTVPSNIGIIAVIVIISIIKPIPKAKRNMHKII